MLLICVVCCAIGRPGLSTIVSTSTASPPRRSAAGQVLLPQPSDIDVSCPETSFLPGRVFASPADFNIQLADWLAKANRRIHRTLQARPLARLEADRSRMLQLPPISPQGWWMASLQLPRDHYVRLDTSDHSVHLLASGRRIEVTADLGQVLVTCDDVEVARHVRCWARRQTLTGPDHTPAAAAARRVASNKKTVPRGRVMRHGESVVDGTGPTPVRSLFCTGRCW